MPKIRKLKILVIRIGGRRVGILLGFPADMLLPDKLGETDELVETSS